MNEINSVRVNGEKYDIKDTLAQFRLDQLETNTFDIEVQQDTLIISNEEEGNLVQVVNDTYNIHVGQNIDADFTYNWLCVQHKPVNFIGEFTEDDFSEGVFEYYYETRSYSITHQKQDVDAWLILINSNSPQPEQYTQRKSLLIYDNNGVKKFRWLNGYANWVGNTKPVVQTFVNRQTWMDYIWGMYSWMESCNKEDTYLQGLLWEATCKRNNVEDIMPGEVYEVGLCYNFYDELADYWRNPKMDP